MLALAPGIALRCMYDSERHGGEQVALELKAQAEVYVFTVHKVSFVKAAELQVCV